MKFGEVDFSYQTKRLLIFPPPFQHPSALPSIFDHDLSKDHLVKNLYFFLSLFSYFRSNKNERGSEKAAGAEKLLLRSEKRSEKTIANANGLDRHWKAEIVHELRILVFMSILIPSVFETIKNDYCRHLDPESVRILFFLTPLPSPVACTLENDFHTIFIFVVVVWFWYC